MTDEDLKAIYAFIRSLGAPGKAAPAYVAPGGKVDTPYFVFVPQVDQTARRRTLRRASARNLGQHDGPQDVEPEASAARLLDAQRRAALLEPALQQDQPGLEVLAQFRQADRRVEAQLAVGVLGAAFLDVRTAAIATGSHRPRP